LLHQNLKTNTSIAHQSLEKQIITYLKAMNAVSEYRLLLQAYYGFIEPVEGAIRQHIDTAEVKNIDTRMRAGVLQDDLASLGLDDLKAIPRAPMTSFVHDAPSALGALYVLEGSTLGGTFIVQMIRRKFPLENALRYFAGYGENNAAMWAAFTQLLNQGQSTVFQDAAVLAANNTFNQFEKWLQQELQLLSKNYA
jgi:heme oxygenase